MCVERLQSGIVIGVSQRQSVISTSASVQG